MVNHTHGTILTDKLFRFSPEQAFQQRKVVSTSENGKKYCLALNPPHKCVVYQVDGNIITTGERCDKLVLVEYDVVNTQWAEVFVELKGGDVAHAVDQLRCSIKNDLFSHPTVKKKHARIIAQNIPRNSGHSVVERARDEFRRTYGTELKCWSSGRMDSLE